MKNLIIVIAAFLNLNALAQPVITGATNNPLPGDTFHIIGCDTSGVRPGSPGASVTWDFSSLATDYVDSISFLACSATPYCDSFPGATLSVTFDGSYFDYLRTDTSEFASLGSYDGSDMVRFDDPYAISVFPMTYGNVRVDTVAQHFDTMQFLWAIDSFIADGYGTLKLPTGTYDSVLRVHIISYEKDSSMISTGTYSVEWFRSESYYWYRPGFRFILLSQYYDTSGVGSLYPADVWYCKYTLPIPSTSIAGKPLRTRILVYPNPASEAFMVELKSNSKQSALIAVTDVAGKTIVSTQLHEIVTGTNNIPIKTNDWSAGIYFVHVATSDGEITRNIMIER